MKRTSWLLFAILALLVAMPLRAQEEKPKSDTAKQNDSARLAARPVNWYRLDITMNEFEDGRKINTRRYTVHINDIGDRSSTKFGTRVPVTRSAQNGDFNYIDVGLNLNARIVERFEHNLLELAFELSSFAIPEQAKQTAPGVPILRQVQTSVSVPLTIPKATPVAVLDDPNSTKRYEFEATLTKM
jgi:hypothetical protein